MGFFNAFKGAFGVGGNKAGSPMGGPPVGGMGGVQMGAPGGNLGKMKAPGGAQMGQAMGQPQMPGGFAGKLMGQLGAQMPGQNRYAGMSSPLPEHRGGFTPDGNPGFGGGGFYSGGLGRLAQGGAQMGAQAGLAPGSAPGDMKGEKDFGGEAEMGGDAAMAQPQTFSQGGAFGAPQFQQPRKFSGFRSMRGGRR